jgi:UPF0755 protein
MSKYKGNKSNVKIKIDKTEQKLRTFFYVFLLCSTIFFIFILTVNTKNIKSLNKKADNLLFEANNAIQSSHIYDNKFNKTGYITTLSIDFKPNSNTVYEKVIEKAPNNPNIITTNSENLITIHIPEGENIYELCDYFENANTSISKKLFLDAIKDDNFYNELSTKYSILPKINKNIRFLFEGYLLGGNYKISDKTTAKELIEMMVKNTQNAINDLSKNLSLPINKSYSYSELISLASIVEKESNDSNDRKIIAGTLYNRLNHEQRLQSDVTVLYALGVKNRSVKNKDTMLESLYNTYYTDALPVGAINSPSKDSLNATLHPNVNNYYFFFGTGIKTVFATTFEEHKNNISKYN